MDLLDRSSPAAADLRGRVVVAVAGLLAQAVILYVPRAPDPSGGALPPWFDKVVHVAVFALVTTLTLRVCAHVARRVRRRAVLAVVALHALQAPVSELLQHALLPGRSGSTADMVADLVGVALGASVWWALGGRILLPSRCVDPPRTP